MKKYLIKGLLALVVGGFTASCADKDGDYVPVGQQKATAYADAFKELIGGEVAPNHDWGFTKTSIVSEPAGTRVAAVNSNQWFDGVTEQFKHLVKPADVTAREEQVVSDWFKNNQHPTCDPIYLSEFFVQQVYFGTKSYNGTDNNGHAQSVVGGSHMDYLYAWDPSKNALDHINNFNTSAPSREGSGLNNMQLMQNSSTETFGFHESFNSDNQRYYYEKNVNWVIKAIPVDGVWGYYVGFDYESHGNQGEYNPDGFFDDRIVKIVPGNGVYNYTPGSSSSSSTSTRTDSIELRRIVAQGRVFCEDLGTSAERMTKSDIDFNDAVFDAKIWRLSKKTVNYTNNVESGRSGELENAYPGGLENGKYKYIAEIRLLAAGGTVPLKIGGNNGFEIHAKFGEGNNKTIGHTTIINTMGAPSQANFSTTVSTETCDAVTVEVDITSLVAGKSEIGLDIIPIEVQWVSSTGQTVGELTADYDQAPQKLCVPIGTPWVYERIPITDAYKDFASYATSRTPKFWEGTNKDESLLYPSIPEGMTAETDADVTNNINNNKCYEKTISKGQTTTTQVDNIDLWLGTKEFDNATQGSNVQLYSKDIVANDVLRVYGSNGNADNHYLQIALIENSDDWKWTDDLYNGNVDFSNGHIDIPVNTNIKDRLDIRDYLGIYGQNITITRIERIRTTVSHN